MITKKKLLSLYLDLDEKVYALEEKIAKMQVDLEYRKLFAEPKKQPRSKDGKFAKKK